MQPFLRQRKRHSKQLGPACVAVVVKYVELRNRTLRRCSRRIKKVGRSSSARRSVLVRAESKKVIEGFLGRIMSGSWVRKEERIGGGRR